MTSAQYRKRMKPMTTVNTEEYCPNLTQCPSLLMPKLIYNESPLSLMTEWFIIDNLLLKTEGVKLYLLEYL